MENKKTPAVKINFKGVAIGDGLIDPEHVSYCFILIPCVNIMHTCQSLKIVINVEFVLSVY